MPIKYSAHLSVFVFIKQDSYYHPQILCALSLSELSELSITSVPFHTVYTFPGCASGVCRLIRDRPSLRYIKLRRQPMADLTYEEWKDPSCVSVNRLPPRASFVPYASSDEALSSIHTNHSRENEMASSSNNTRTMLLDSQGAWAFKWFPSVAAAGLNADATSTSTSRASSNSGSNAWTTMPVPGNWELQGRSKADSLPFPIYTNIGYAWAGGGVPTAPPAIAYKEGAGRPADYNPTGLYRRTLHLPPDFLKNGQRVVLYLGAVTSAVTWFENTSVHTYTCLVENEFNVTHTSSRTSQSKIRHTCSRPFHFAGI